MEVLFRSFQANQANQAKLAASIVVFLVVVIIGWLLPLTPPSVFEVQARIWIQQKLPSTDLDGRQHSSLFQSFMTYFNSPILTACEVLKSTLVCEEAINDLKKKLPRDRIPSLSEVKNIKVEPVNGTDIISVSYRSVDAYVASSVVQAVLDAYARLQSRQTSYSASQSQSFLKTQLADAQKQLETVNEKIKKFQSANPSCALPAQVDELISQRRTIEEAIKDSKARAQETKAKVKFLESRLGISADDANKTALSDKSSLNSEARAKLARLECERMELSTRFRPAHPRMRELDNLINKMRSSVSTPDTQDVKPSKAAGALFSTADDDTLKDLVALRSEELAQRSRASALSGTLAGVDGQFKTLPEKQLKLADLLRAQKLATERLSTLEEALGSARLLEAVSAHAPNFEIIDRPQVAGVTVSSKKPKVFSAALLGLVLGALTFFGLDWLDPRIRRIPPVLKTLPIPVIGWFPHLPQNISNAVPEPIHRLRLGLKNWISDQRRQFVVTSCDGGDGKSTVAAYLAMSMAQAGMRVLLVDANTARPTQHQFFECPQSPGLSDYLDSPDPRLWSKIIFDVGKNLKVIPSGSKRGCGLASSDVLVQVTELMRATSDIVIYDTPPTNESATALALLSSATNLLVVVRLDHTHMPALRLLATQIKRHECGESGLILANVHDFAVAAALSKNEPRHEDLELV